MKFCNTRFILLGALVLLLLLFSACQDDTATVDSENEQNDNTVDNTDEGNVEPLKGGTVTGAMFSTPAGMFNPLFYEEPYEANMIHFTHESLFTQNGKLEFENDLAKDDWELNDDQTELTIHLEENVTWHDGEPFTADDVVFTYQSIADPDYVKAGGLHSSYVTQLAGYEAYVEEETDKFKGVVAEDEYTVVFHFAKPTVTPEYIASFPIIPKHIFNDIPVIDMPKADESLEPGAIIGTGPFQLVDMKEREQYVLEKYDDYWKNEPYLDKIVWKIIEQTDVTDLLEAGEIDFVANPGSIAPIEYNSVNNFEHIEIIEQAGFQYQLLGFKHHYRSTEDVEEGVIEPDNWEPNKHLPKEVRQAISYAIDRTALIGEKHGEGLLHGKGHIINAPIAMQSWAYDDESTINYTYNPDKAADLLDEAGYELDEDGFRTDPGGNEWTINLDYPLGNKLRERAAPLIKEHLKDVGIQVNLRKADDMSDYVPKLIDDDTDWDLYMIGWDLDSKEPDPLGTWGIKEPYNFSRWNNPKSDELLHQAVKAPEALDQDKRADIYREWQQLFSEDLPGLPLFVQNSLWAYNKRLHGLTPLPHTMYQDPHLWWVDEIK